MSTPDGTHDSGVRHSQIGIHLPGIIKTLGESLYSDKSVAIRELVQNASDSLVNRQLNDPACPSDLRVDIECDYLDDLLVIRDNGAGMTEAEISNYLSTVGRSGTAELRKALEQENREEARRLIGCFGLGLLSAFVIADSVEVHTRSFRDGSPGYAWNCDGGADYTLCETQVASVGTTISLHLKSEQDSFADKDVVAQLVRRYADFLEFPIHIGDSPLPVNVQTAPWHCGASSAEYAEYLANRFGEAAMEVIPMCESADDVDVGGALFIPESRANSLPTVDLYVSRMYVGRERELLPGWARFVGGILDSPSLDVTTSRESIVRNPRFQRVQRLVAERLSAFVSNLAISEPSRFRNVLETHEQAVKIGAMEDDRFFDLVKNHVRFDSDSGKVTLPAYIERATRGRASSPKTIYYHTGGVESRQHQLLFAANGVPVLDAEEQIDRAFIKKYAEREKGVRAKTVDQAADALFEAAPTGTLEPLIERYADMDIVTKAVSFRPVSIPALLVRSESSAEDGLLAMLNDPDIPDMLRNLFTAMTQGRMGKRGSAWTLYLNSGNEVIRLLSELDGSDEVAAQCMKEVYNSAYLVASKGLSIQDVERMADMHTQTVAMLLRLAAGRGRANGSERKARFRFLGGKDD